MLRKWVSIILPVSLSSNSIAALAAAAAFRAAGLRVEVSYKAGKLGRQFKLAHRRQARFVVVVGPDEAASGAVQLKDMTTGEQRSLPLSEAVSSVT